MKSVAVIGASTDRSKFGNKAVRAFQSQNWRVYPIHPTETEVEGLRAYRSVTDLPERPNWVTIYVRSNILESLLPEIAAKGCDELWLNPGTSSPAVLEAAELHGLNAVEGCSILAIGASPEAF